MHEQSLPADSELIQGFLKGETEAVEAVRGWITRAAYPFRARLSHAWDDLLQEIYLELVRALRQGRFRGESSLKTYVWRTAGYVAIGKLRKQTRWTESQQRLERTGGSTTPASPLDLLLRQEAHDVRLEVLGRVPEECRRMWRWIVEGRSYRQMSRRLGVTEGTLRVRVLRCRRRLIELLRERLSPPTSVGTGEAEAGGTLP